MQGKCRRARVVAFGCQMSERDSETIAGLLSACGYDVLPHGAAAAAAAATTAIAAEGDTADGGGTAAPVADSAPPDMVLFVTCCVRGNAENRAIGNLGDMKRLKERNPGMIVAVAGCMAQEEGMRRLIVDKMPWVDLVFGTHNIQNLPAMLARVEAGERVIEVLDDSDSIAEHLPAIRAYRHKAFVNITFGCDNFCTYCIVPYVRGRERSRTEADILKEVSDLVDAGCREVTLLGQNVNAYGKGLPPLPDGSVPGFAHLLRAVNGVEGLRRIRFTTSHPRDFTPDMIRACAESERVCRHLHLPLQAGSDRVLARMHRGYTLKRYLELLDEVRSAMPDVAITTDLMVGFPGETEEDFLETLRAVAEARFDAAFTFVYSPREGTVAAGMPDQVDEAVKGDRIRRLIEAVNESAAASNAALVGSVQEVMVEGPSERDSSVMAGRTRTNKMVHWPTPQPPRAVPAPGDILNIRIEQASVYTLRGVEA